MPDALLASSTGIARLYAVAVGENKAAAQPPGQADAATQPPGAADDAATSASNAGARAKVLGWARRTIDLIPTSWLITGAGAALLATTAAFGGLATAPADPIPELAIGDTFKGSDFEFTVVGVELWDDNGNAAVFPDEEKGEKVLVVTVDVLSTFDKPRRSSSISNDGLLDEVRVSGFDIPPEVSLAADGTFNVVLQPDVQARLLLSWIVERGELADDDHVTVTLPDSTHHVGQSVLRGVDYWDDLRVGATVAASVSAKDVP